MILTKHRPAVLLSGKHLVAWNPKKRENKNTNLMKYMQTCFHWKIPYNGQNVEAN